MPQISARAMGKNRAEKRGEKLPLSDMKIQFFASRNVPSLLDSCVSRIVDDPVISKIDRVVSRIIDSSRFIFPYKERACVRACRYLLYVCSNV